jgi:4,5:9,10-diseco-3-hydroxy-5,9,17-trioxoandrosta-1(10),2-diene-4-oate hydrolase
LAQLPNFIEATLGTLSSAVGPSGQREVLLDELPRLRMPTLVVWGTEDRVLPCGQARDALARLKKGSLELVPNCGHLPHVERPERFVSILDGFLRKAS